jgi:hypothetical protein
MRRQPVRGLRQLLGGPDPKVTNLAPEESDPQKVWFDSGGVLVPDLAMLRTSRPPRRSVVDPTKLLILESRTIAVPRFLPSLRDVMTLPEDGDGEASFPPLM